MSRLGDQRCLEGMTDHNNTTTKVVVIGGGYAGTLAANHLRMRTDVDISLVNPRPKFVQRIRLHQLVAGTGDPTVDYGTMLGEGVHLVVDSATRIDTAARQVQLESGRALDYDYVIYAVGSTGGSPSTVPSAAEFAYPIGEFEYAQRLRTTLDKLHPDAPVTVVGAGLTGTETAAELAEQGRNVTLVCGGQLAPSSPNRDDARPPNGWPNTASPCSRPTWWPRSGPTRSSSPTERCVRARSPSGRPVSGFRSWPPAVGCAPTHLAGCSPTRR